MTTVNGALAGTVIGTAGGATVTIVGTNFRTESRVTIAVPGGLVTLGTGLPAVAGYAAYAVAGSGITITFTVSTAAFNTGGPVNIRVVNGAASSTATSTLAITGGAGMESSWIY